MRNFALKVEKDRQKQFFTHMQLHVDKIILKKETLGRR